MKYAFIFFILFMSIVVNLPTSYIARLGMDPDYLLAALSAIVITGLIADRKLMFIVLVIFLSFGANMPEDYMLSIGIDPDYLLATLIAIILVPLFI